LYWSKGAGGYYEGLARAPGPALEEAGAIGHGYSDGAERRAERHPLLFARKPL
jgi:hypothetical protein